MKNEIYSEIILDLYKNPPNKGELGNPEIYADGGNPSCGDQVKFYLIIKNNTIQDIKFQGHGCAISIAAESLLTDMVKGKTINQTKKITSNDLFKELGNIIQTRIKCALLGYSVLQKAIEEYEKAGNKKIEIKNIVI
ncbi:MAG: SUF system NifU family Fe-S cluster assembly protein [Candidatus Diapherotrites archaeon CG11_big_fil_rev_8_21_14_0_20_37_9]|nr:MAG: SUF system NifU family Fe-S cluster assembly protein [Candidatus Diapherotrites archaeon CG11_big_fil_rev_8_21_14_0_20_37_9]